MTLPKKYRPAWKGMGWWRWLSIFLIAYSLVLIVPYVLYGGGSHEIRGSQTSGLLGNCKFWIGVEEQETAVHVMVKIDASCVQNIELPSLELLDPQQKTLSTANLRGNPNALVARLSYEDFSAADVAEIAIRTRSRQGDKHAEQWPISEFRR